MKHVASAVYAPPQQSDRDREAIEIAWRFGGELHSTDEPPDSKNIELWFEFPSTGAKAKAAQALRDAGFFVEDWGCWDG
jgi:hypothetical protein